MKQVGKNYWGTILVAIIAFVIVLWFCINNVKENDNTSIFDWIPLIVAGLNLSVTLVSRAGASRELAISEENNALPYLVLDKVKIWECQENESRVPWGGDPEPGDVYPIFSAKAMGMKMRFVGRSIIIGICRQR